MRGGPSGPFLRAIARTGQFHLTRADGPGAMAVRTRIQTLTHHQVERLPPSLQEAHADWVRTARAEPTPAERRVRARRLALSLVELGEPAEAVELQLHRWQVHPALAHEALRWALERTGRPAAGAPMAPAPLATAAAGPERPVPGPGSAPSPIVRSVPGSARPRPTVGPAGDAA